MREKVVLSVQLISYTTPIVSFVINPVLGMNLGANLFTMKTDFPVHVIISNFVVGGTYYLGKHGTLFNRTYFRVFIAIGPKVNAYLILEI